MWWKLIVLLGVFLLLWTIFSAVMRKLLNVEKQKFFSSYHVNDNHKKLDRVIGGVAIAILFIGFIINSMREPEEWLWFFEPAFIMVLYMAFTQIAKAVMERKHAENPNLYKVTISEAVFLLAFFISLFVTDFWGLA